MEHLLYQQYQISYLSYSQHIIKFGLFDKNTDI